MNNEKMISAGALIGLTLILSAFYIVQGPDNSGQYCQEVEDAIEEEGELNGTTSCYLPEDAGENLDLPEELENRTDLGCVCVNTFEGEESIFTINIAR